MKQIHRNAYILFLLAISVALSSCTGSAFGTTKATKAPESSVTATQTTTEAETPTPTPSEVTVIATTAETAKTYTDDELAQIVGQYWVENYKAAGSDVQIGYMIENSEQADSFGVSVQENYPDRIMTFIYYDVNRVTMKAVPNEIYQDAETLDLNALIAQGFGPK